MKSCADAGGHAGSDFSGLCHQRTESSLGTGLIGYLHIAHSVRHDLLHIHAHVLRHGVWIVSSAALSSGFDLLQTKPEVQQGLLVLVQILRVFLEGLPVSLGRFRLGRIQFLRQLHQFDLFLQQLVVSLLGILAGRSKLIQRCLILRLCVGHLLALKLKLVGQNRHLHGFLFRGRGCRAIQLLPQLILQVCGGRVQIEFVQFRLKGVYDVLRLLGGGLFRAHVIGNALGDAHDDIAPHFVPHNSGRRVDIQLVFECLDHDGRHRNCGICRGIGVFLDTVGQTHIHIHAQKFEFS